MRRPKRKKKKKEKEKEKEKNKNKNKKKKKKKRKEKKKKKEKNKEQDGKRNNDTAFCLSCLVIDMRPICMFHSLFFLLFSHSSSESPLVIKQAASDEWHVSHMRTREYVRADA